MPNTSIKKIERKSRTIESHPAEVYARQAASGEIVVSKWVRLAAQRHLRDLNEAHRRGLWFDTAAAQDVLDFFSLLHHSKGEFAKEEFKPEPWQQFILWVLFGWMRADGTRRFRSAYVEVARKNGKSTLCSGIGLYCLSADKEEGAEVYCVATKLAQAKDVVFAEATRMRKASPGLAKRIESWRNNMCMPETNSKMEPLGADSDTLDGLNVSCGIVDELHAHKSAKLLQVIETATGARRQPLIFKITTAGHNRESVCWAERERGTAILEDVKKGDDVFAFIACIDEGDDWKDESNWIKANPNLNVSVKLETLREDARKADQQPSSLNGFLRLRLNVWTNQEHAAIKIEQWNQCVGFSLQGTDAKVLRDQKLKELEGRDCIIAVDLSSTEDVTASVKLFPPLDDEPPICIPDFWLPKDNVEEKMDKWRSTSASYDDWDREGFLHLTEGDVIDYDEIEAQVLDDCRRYNVKEITFDPWNATQFANDLQKAGIHVDKLVKFPQTVAMFAEPTKRLLETMIPGKKIAHLGNPVLRWMASNLVVKEDNNGNKRPVKKANAAKIDGMVALIMAIGRTIAAPPKAKSVYETRGVLTL